MKRNEQALNTAKLVLAASLAALLAACGGGGGDSTSVQAAAPVVPQVKLPTDPYTGKDAAGTPTAGITGSVINAATAGATVTAYLLNPDGSNGASLGTATTDANGAFSLTLSQMPTAMIRLVATGGTFTSEGDASVQKNDSLELVAPYVTTALSNFVLTPLTNAASQNLKYLAGTQGKALTEAYTTASSAVLQLVTGNNVIAGNNRAHGGVDYLAIVPGSAQDSLNAYGDAVTAIEYYGVDHDLPSRVVVRALAQSNAAGKLSTTTPDGQAINVGKWVGTAFDETAVFTLAQVSGGYPATDLQSIVQAMNAAKACASGDHSGYYQRYPLPTGQTDYLDAVACTTYTNKINTIKAKTATNNRNKYVS